MGNTQKLGTLVNGLFTDASGNVGIGGSPSGSYKLQVSGSLATSQLWQLADNSAEMKIGRYNSSFPNAYIDAIGPSGDVGFQFRTQVGGAGGGTKMVITAAGNVGIGTSSPSQSLSIAYSNGGAQTIIYNTSTGHSVFSNNTADKDINYQVSGTGGHYFATAGLGRVSILSDGHLKLTSTSGGGTNLDMYLLENDGLYLNSNEGATARGIYFQTGGTERMRISSGGNVLIGNGTLNTPSNLLSIATTSADQGIVLMTQSNGATNSRWGIVNPGINNTAYIGTFVNNDFAFYSYSIERMRITTAGSVCINTTTADAQGLSFNASGTGVTMYLTNPSVNAGTEYIILNNTTSGTHTTTNMQFRRVGTVKGSITNDNSTTSFNTTSDYRLKEDFKDFNALSIIDLIKVYDFKWKIENKRMHGVIAHEIAEVLPYTTFGEKDGLNEKGEMMPQQVDYGKLTPVLLKAIKELKAEIDILKNK
jgi:hypothetical protein